VAIFSTAKFLDCDQAMSKTIFEKIWHAHVVDEVGGWTILYIDRHLGHDGAARAFNILEERGIAVRRPDKTLISVDHVLSTRDQSKPPPEASSRHMLEVVRENAAKRGIENFFDMGDPRNGIAHVVSPEQGFTIPGITLVCGDSHTATHGALGALAFGIGASEVAHVFATQALLQRRPLSMLVKIEGARPPGVAAKDVILGLIGRIGTGGGTGCVIEYAGTAISAMTVEERMTVCNMTIEAGARAGLVAPDEATYAYLKGRPLAPQGAEWDQAEAFWRTLPTDAGASYDKTVEMDVSRLAPQVTWGTNPGMVAGVDGAVPELGEARDANQREAWERALGYMDLKPKTRMTDIKIDRVFIGSCTNSRIEDLRAAAGYVKGRQVASTVEAWVVPGSRPVKQQAEQEGLHRIFSEAGFQWREPGCSLCVGMNDDLLQPGERCASTSNRNFEGRQGRGSRTHLVSPAMAAAAAVAGQFVDVRELEPAV
jgi:3-isopropylmalate/(R)-2-methylmalate dehydratase large subunit